MTTTSGVTGRSVASACTDTSPPSYVAVVGGWPAFLLAAVLDRELPEQLAAARRHGVHPDRIAAVERLHAAVRRAASEWASAASAASGSERPLVGASAEISTADAAVVLGVSESRVRQRLRARDLPGRLVGRRWRVDAAAVHAACEE